MIRFVLKTSIWLLILAGIAFGVGTLFFKPRVAADDSMAPNIMAGDKYLVCYRCDIEKADPIVCDHPDPSRQGVRIMGRVVGMEGDKVEVRRGILRVNDMERQVRSDNKPFKYVGLHGGAESSNVIWFHQSLFGREVNVLLPPTSSAGALPERPPQIVKKGHYFLMGDHRLLNIGWTKDGRLAAGGDCNSSFCYGQIPKEKCHGVVFFTYDPAERGGNAGASERRFSFVP